MPTSLFLFLFVSTVALTTTTTTLRRLSAVDPLSPSPANPPSTPHQLPLPTLPIPPPQSSPPPPEYIQQQQLKNIIDALIGAGDFAAWANILFNPNTNSTSTTIPTSTTAALIPTTATMFVPGNDALTHLTATATGAFSFDPFIIPYHILPQRLTFSELQLFKTLTRLPTLLPSKTVIITNNTASNFTIDDALITQPDIYLTPAVCVHGIGAVLDYTVYGDADSTTTTPASDFLPAPPIPTAAADGEETEMGPPVVRNSCGSICVLRLSEDLIFRLVVFVCTSIWLRNLFLQQF